MDSVEEVRVPSVDPQKLDAFLGRAVNDMGAAMSGLLVVMGDRLGLYKAMAGARQLRRVSAGERGSRWPRPRTSPVRAATWSAYSTLCMRWVTRSAPRGTSGGLWPRTAP